LSPTTRRLDHGGDFGALLKVELADGFDGDRRDDPHA
jgi:hypothetical protein